MGRAKPISQRKALEYRRALWQLLISLESEKRTDPYSLNMRYAVGQAKRTVKE